MASKDFLKEEFVVDWLDYMGEKLDLFEVARNEFLADTKLPPKNLMFYRHVILPFCENTLIMDNIAYSEGIHYEKGQCCNKLKIITKINNTEIKAYYEKLLNKNNEANISYPDNFPFLIKTTEKDLESAFKQSELRGVEDIEICLGSEHAIYSILENMIRNSAKHNKSRIKDTLEIIVNVKDIGEDDYYTIQIFDNISAVNKTTIKDFQQKINASLINEKGEIEKANLGIADIKINAHLLKTDSDINDENLKKAIELIYRQEYDESQPIEEGGKETGYYEPLRAISNEFEVFANADGLKEGKIYNFGYQFNLCKPKKVIWIGKDELEVDPDKKCRKRGVVFCKERKNFKPDSNIQNDEPLANYQFAILELEAVEDLTNKLVFDDGDIKKVNDKASYQWDDFLIKLPHRILLNTTKDKIANNISIKKLIDIGRIQLIENSINCNTKLENWDFIFIEQLWQKWLKSKWGIGENNIKGRLIVYFEDKILAEKWCKVERNESFDMIVLYGEKVKRNGSEEIEVKEDLCDRSIDYKSIDNDRIVIYDHHGQAWRKIKSKQMPGDGILQNKCNFINKDAYFQFDKSSDDYVKFAFPDLEINQKLFAYEAIDAGLKKILIADERIAEMLIYNDNNISAKITGEEGFYSKSEFKADYSDLANNGNTFIITNFSTSKIVKDDKFRNLEIFFNKNKFCFEFRYPEIKTNGILFKCLKVDFDCLVIHRTYLIQFFDENKEVNSKRLMNLLYKTFKNIVVVSGGGYPHSLDFGVKFKPYSQLKRNFVKYPSKISLNKII